GNQCLVIQPPWLASAERDESGYVWDFRSNTIDPFKVIDVRTDDARAAVLNQIRKVVGGQPVVQRDQNGADLRHGIKRFQLRMGIDRKSTRLNSSHLGISYAVFCLKKKK